MSTPRPGALAGAAIVALAAPPLAFPLQMPVIAGCAVAAVFGYCLWDVGRNGLPSWPRAFLVSVGILYVMIVVGALRSPFADVTAPKFCSLVLGLAVMWVIDRGIVCRRDLMLAIGGYVVAGVMLVIVGSLGTTWQWKFAGLYSVAHMVPRGIENLPGTDGGVSANALGAAVLLVWPVGAMALWSVTYPGSTAGLRRLGFGTLAAGVLRAGCVLAILVMSTILLLTQSRTAWLSLAVTVAGLAAMRSRMARRLVVTITVLGVILVSLIGPKQLLGDVERLVRLANVAGPHFALNLGERAVVWGYAFEQLRESPVLGIGLGAFRRTMRPLSMPSASSGADIAHAHNVFIQTALDVGCIGLAAYIAILLLSLGMAWRSYRWSDAPLRYLAFGLGGNVIAVHLFGLVDAVALGAKIGVLLWGSIGLIAAMHRLADARAPARALAHPPGDPAECRRPWHTSRLGFYATHGKRAMDVAAASVLLVAALPVMALLAVAVRLAIGRPVFFVQNRPGRGGRVFRLIKFRSMTEERDCEGRELPDDQRLGRFARVLRRTSLDELPELLNVLKGDMSLVGPRPLLVEYLAHYTPEQARRHDVRPGLTGWAEVNGRNALSWEDRFRLDVWYVDHVSLALDLRTMARTALKVMTGEGVSEPGHATKRRFTGSTASQD